MNLVAPKSGAKYKLLFNKPTSGLIGRFVERKFMLSCAFMYGQMHIPQCYDSALTLLCRLSQTLMFNKLASPS